MGNGGGVLGILPLPFRYLLSLGMNLNTNQSLS